jgi:hypothetical protein
VKGIAPHRDNAQKPLVPTQVYSLTLGEFMVESDMVTSIIPISGFKVSMLFDYRVTYSFMSSTFVKICT